MRSLKLIFGVVLLLPVLVACGTPAVTPLPTATAPAAPPKAAPTVDAATPAAAPTKPAAQAAATPMASAGTSAVKVTSDPKLGDFLADAKGMTLYRFTRDEPNVSNCYDQCAQSWPPLLLPSGEPVAPAGLSGTLGVIMRRDGGRQVTYNRMPLYYFARDEKPGDTKGQGVNDVWFVVQPGATP